VADSSTSEYAPVRRDIARRKRLTQLLPWEDIASLPITSVSEVVSNGTPSSCNSARMPVALVTLPLCPIASQPRVASSKRRGWALHSLEEPVVE
jgi:hypothetical protein